MSDACRVLLVMLCAASCAAQTPVVRAHLEPTNGIVGQPVRLVVSVFVPNYFTGSPDFPELEFDNAIVVLPQDRPQNSNEQISGVTYAGITGTYTIYPQQPGDFRLPAAAITVSYAGKPPETTIAHVSIPVLTFHADVPAAARELDYFLPTTHLTIQQKWSSPLKNLRAGDSIERTVTVTATKMQAMLIPPLPLEAPSGIRMYEEEPVVQDQKTDRVSLSMEANAGREVFHPEGRRLHAFCNRAEMVELVHEPPGQRGRAGGSLYGSSEFELCRGAAAGAGAVTDHATKARQSVEQVQILDSICTSLRSRSRHPVLAFLALSPTPLSVVATVAETTKRILIS